MKLINKIIIFIIAVFIVRKLLSYFEDELINFLMQESEDSKSNLKVKPKDSNTLGKSISKKVTKFKSSTSKIISKSEKIPVYKKSLPANLNSRQKDILKQAKKLKEFSLSDLLENTNVSDRTLRRDMEVLQNNKFVVKRGNTKNTKYQFIQYSK